MKATTVTKKGQITIPKVIREQLVLKEGDKELNKLEGNIAIIKKIPSIFDLQGSVKVPKEVGNLSWKEIEKRAHDYMVKKAGF